MTFQHDQHARDLPPLHKVKQFASVIKMADGNLRRSSTAFGSPTAVQPAPPVVYSTDPVETSGQPDRAVMDSTTPVTTTNGWTENIVQTNENGLYVTRSGRHIKQPQRFS